MLKPGNKAPDFSFITPWAIEQEFYQTTGEMPAVLVFLRYHGCPICKMEMANLKREIDIFKQKKAKVYVILQSSPETISSLASKEDWPFTIVCDQNSKIFQLYNVEPGGIFKYLHPAGLIAAIKATFRGFMHGKFEGKETQLPAGFVLSSDKIIKYVYYGKNISDIPSPATLAAEIK